MGTNPFLFLVFQAASGVIIFILPPVYLMIYGLIPSLLIKKKYVAFILATAASIVAWGYFVGFLEPWTDEHWFGMDPEPQHPENGLTAVSFLFLITCLVNLSYRWFMQGSKIRRMENDHLKKELSLLKNQINPHFLFNTLNNLYALSLEESEDTPRVILKLSELMRYAVYECKEPFVSIEKEVKYLDNYLALQQIRQHEDCRIIFDKSIEDSSVKIAPMILIVLVENAVKHGVESMSEGAFVHIQLRVDSEKITFRVENNVKEMEPGKEGGLGLENVKRRLSMIYGNAYSFETQKMNDRFIANLEISL